MVSRNTTLVPSLGLRIGPACEAGFSARMRRERVSLQIRKKEKKKTSQVGLWSNEKYVFTDVIIPFEYLKHLN